MYRMITLNVNVELLDAVVCGHRPAEGPWCDVLVALPLGPDRPGIVPVTAPVRAWREFCCVAGCVPRLRDAALRLHGRMIRAMAAWAPKPVWASWDPGGPRPRSRGRGRGGGRWRGRGPWISSRVRSPRGSADPR